MYNAAVWLDRVKKEYGDNLSITWKNFSLEQVNSKNGPGWKVWEQPDDYASRGLPAMRAGEAARKQGQEPFERFHMALLIARHGGERRNIADPDVLVELAASAGLDVKRFKADLADRKLLNNVARDHTEAVEKHGVFGTPTFVFENGGSGYLKMFIPPEEDDIPLFDAFVKTVKGRLYFGELKRPQPPWPKGIFTSTE